MVRSKQAGFTLIEVTIVMAITSALAITALAGFSTARASAQFSDSVEQAKEQLLVQRTAATASVDTNGTGTNQATITLGKLVTFTPGSAAVASNTLTTTNTADASTNPAVKVLAEPGGFNLKWGLVYTGYTDGTGTHASVYKLAFTRALAGAAPQTAGSPSWSNTRLSYSQIATGSGQVQLNFKDPDGRKAFIAVNLSDGGVTRTIQ